MKKFDLNKICFIINYWIWNLIIQIQWKINIWFKLNSFKNHMFILKICVKGNIHMFYSNKFWSFSLTITHVVYLLKFCFCFFFFSWKLWMEPSHINIIHIIWGQIKIYCNCNHKKYFKYSHFFFHESNKTLVDYI